MSLEVHYTQAEMSQIRAKDLMDSKFLGSLIKVFPDARIQSINISLGERNGASLFHTTKKKEEEGKLVIDVTVPESFEKLLSVMKEFESKETAKE